MIIGVDAGCLGVADDRLKVGVYNVCYNLFSQITKIDKKNKYLLYSLLPISPEILESFGDNVENRVLAPKRGWLSLRLSLEFLIQKPDIFLGFGQSLPLYHPAKNIIIVYDLSFEYYPENYESSYHRLSRQTRYATKNADKIVAISKSTKKDLINLYGINSKKIVVIYPGVDPIFASQSQKEVSRVRKKYSLSTPYLLYVGSLKPIKNIPNIIEAFGLLLKRVRRVYKLVLAGSDYWLDSKIYEKIKLLRLEKDVLMLGYLPKDDLPGIYSGATAFVSPSLYEGFGLPLLEALSCGVPVITSNTGSMPEVVGEAGILVDPKNIKEIASAMNKLISDKSLNDKLIEKGLKQAKKFSWEKSAFQLLTLINTLQ